MLKKYRWNPIAGRYIDGGGRFVSWRSVRIALDAVLDGAERDIKDASARLQAGQITLGEWREVMRTSIKSIHLASAASVMGGWAQMSPADYGRVGKIVRGEYEYLRRFVRQIQRGLPLDGRFLQRTGLYAQSGRTTYHETERAERAKRGLTEERNILEKSAHHCTGANSCPEETRRGWVPIGSLVAIGKRKCKANCRCYVEYR